MRIPEAENLSIPLTATREEEVTLIAQACRAYAVRVLEEDAARMEQTGARLGVLEQAAGEALADGFRDLASRIEKGEL